MSGRRARNGQLTAQHVAVLLVLPVPERVLGKSLLREVDTERAAATDFEQLRVEVYARERGGRVHCMRRGVGSSDEPFKNLASDRNRNRMSRHCRAYDRLANGRREAMTQLSLA